MDDRKLTIDDGKQALADHARRKAEEIREKYGIPRNRADLELIFKDSDMVRFPVTLSFSSTHLGEGQFAAAVPIEGDPLKGYMLYVHDSLEVQEDILPHVVLYHLVSVNYGDFATGNEAEIFASTLLEMDQETYYQQICAVADNLP